MQSEIERVRSSLEIKKRLFALKEFKFAKTVMFYVSKDGEVDTIQMIKDTLRMRKRVAVPVEEIDLPIVPGVAFRGEKIGAWSRLN